jgi:hypothetical protein
MQFLRRYREKKLLIGVMARRLKAIMTKPAMKAPSTNLRAPNLPRSAPDETFLRSRDPCPARGAGRGRRAPSSRRSRMRSTRFRSGAANPGTGAARP